MKQLDKRVLIMIGASVLILAIAGGSYYYFTNFYNKKTDQQENQDQKVEQSKPVWNDGSGLVSPSSTTKKQELQAPPAGLTQPTMPSAPEIPKK